MSAKAVLLNALSTRWKKYRSEWKRCRAKFSEQSVHDARVAARRLLAFYDLLRSVLPDKRIQKIRRALKKRLDELDELRDTQVLLADVSQHIQEVPALEVFHKYLKKKERQELRAAAKRVTSRKVGKLAERVEATRTMLSELPEEELAKGLLQVADEAYARVIRLHHDVDADQPATIHKLRIAFKRFRYTVEIIHPLLKKFPRDRLRRMHNYQTLMGNVQDMQVALQALADFTEAMEEPKSKRGHSSSKFDKAKALSIHEHYASRLKNAVLEFLKRKGEMSGFWRPSPETAFPWER
jgi:CHAD domain-containing protein